MAEVHRPKWRRHNVHYIIAKASFTVAHTYSKCDVSNQSSPYHSKKGSYIVGCKSDRNNCTLTIIVMSELCKFSFAQAITISHVCTSKWQGIFAYVLVNNICFDQKYIVLVTFHYCNILPIVEALS